MSNPSKNTNPLDYPAYVRGLRPALPESLGQYVDDELEKLQNAFDNAAYAADKNAEARVATETYARIEGDAAVAGLVTVVEAKINDPNTGLAKAHARITDETTARASADSALSTRTTALEAAVNDPTTGLAKAHSRITAEEQARASADSALASRTSSLEAAVNHADTGLAKAHARITDEATARASADSSLATRATNLETTVGSHTASISTLQSSVNGLRLRYSVTLNSNGYITGFTQNNDGTTGDFTVVADRFRVVSPGQSPQTMFQVDSSGVHYTGKHTITGLTNGTLNADMQMGTGRIIWDNGSYMKVAGVGFGSSNQFIEWFGPKMAISACSESNAKMYLKVNGDAYFGGSLSAGTLKNGGETSSLSANASVTVGPFGSNGNTINAVLSYNHSSSQTTSQPATSAGVNDWVTVASQYGYTSGPDHSGSRTITGGATIHLYRKIGSGAEALVATLNVTGGVEYFQGVRPVVGDMNGSITIQRSYTGSITFTDTAKVAQNRTYRAEIATRSATFLPNNQSQRVSIVSTEE